MKTATNKEPIMETKINGQAATSEDGHNWKVDRKPSRVALPFLLAVALVGIPLLYILVLIPNYRECREAGFSKTYCARALVR